MHVARLQRNILNLPVFCPHKTLQPKKKKKKPVKLVLHGANFACESAGTNIRTCEVRNAWNCRLHGACERRDFRISDAPCLQTELSLPPAKVVVILTRVVLFYFLGKLFLPGLR